MGEKTKGKKNVLNQPLSREFSAGGVVFRRADSEVLWLVTKSRPSELFPKSVWRLPKGWLDDEKNKDIPGPLGRGERKAKEEELKKAALREVQEEGGVDAKIVAKLGTETYFLTINGKRILKFVTFYLMEWMKDLPEELDWETEEVEWLIYFDAYKRLSHKGEKKVLEKAKGGVA